MTRAAMWWTVAAGALGAMAGPGGAERGAAQAPAGWVGLAFVDARPAGGLSSYFDQGYGGQIHGAVPVSMNGHLLLRGDLGFVVYGYERRRLCLPVPVGCRIEADLTTTNSILFGGVGPELLLATGAVQPYVNVSWGLSYFATTSSLSGSSDTEDSFRTTNYDDAMFAWRAGGGLRLRLKAGRTPVALDLGLERHQNGLADFLVKGDIQDNPDGSITLSPHRADADLTTFRVGVTVGIPHKQHSAREGRGGRR